MASYFPRGVFPRKNEILILPHYRASSRMPYQCWSKCCPVSSGVSPLQRFHTRRNFSSQGVQSSMEFLHNCRFVVSTPIILPVLSRASASPKGTAPTSWQPSRHYNATQPPCNISAAHRKALPCTCTLQPHDRPDLVHVGLASSCDGTAVIP